MNVIIISPLGEEKVFLFYDYEGINSYLFDILSGSSLHVYVEFDLDLNKIIRLSYD